MLSQDRIRNTAEKGWEATKRASDALVLAKTGDEAGSGRRPTTSRTPSAWPKARPREKTEYRGRCGPADGPSDGCGLHAGRHWCRHRRWSRVGCGLLRRHPAGAGDNHCPPALRPDRTATGRGNCTKAVAAHGLLTILRRRGRRTMSTARTTAKFRYQDRIAPLLA